MARPVRPARLRTLICATALAVALTVLAAARAAAPEWVSGLVAPADSTAPVAAKPYMGYSTWSLESTNFPGYGGENWLTESHVLEQAGVLASKLKSHGYNYVNLDAGWNVDNGTNVSDGYARPTADPKMFPHGMKYIGDQLHKKGLKFGLHLAVGLYQHYYNNGNTPIYRAPCCTTKDVVSLAWDAVNSGGATTGYDVYANGSRAVTVTGTSATVSGVRPGTGHSFTVVAHDANGRSSAPGKAVAITTPAVGGPVAYEAEAATNTLGGNASLADCAACSGGKKVGSVGYSGSVAIHNVSVPVDGTYLMKIDYTDGSSGRTMVVTTGGTSSQVPLPGSNDNNWGRPKSITVPVHLKAGANTITFGNADDYASDADRVTP
ncbi:CBM35 domain-containing protein [Streptomyces sp. MI02-2A]|uniref:fibronectin type III domain-containing protein n=1 Tax=unclassified Streptomyces TaxID=2593676 RepID=UPI0007C750FF|nr:MULTISPECIES: CBM35 domain-containing protein [unclassified Streptomyces]MDX3258424.1 CBM35 domain-containing protein [Streptomyces sp. MI02-2A]